MNRCSRLATFVALLLIADRATAKVDTPESPLIHELGKCLDIRDDAQRLACTDIAARKLVDAARKRDVVVADKEEIKANRRSLFGFALPNIGLFRSDAGEEVSQVEAKLASASNLGNGKWQLTLDGGAVWVTTEAWQSNVLPKVGAMATVRRTPFGGYFIRLGSGTPTRATRAR